MSEHFDDPSASKVLVVDDDEIVLNAFKEQLPPLGFHPTVVNSATLAKEHLTTEVFAVVIIDGNLGGEGMGLLEQAREAQPDCTRIMLASGISVEELARVLESGLIFRYLTKPWMSNDLHVALANATERYRMIKENESLQNRNMQLSEQMATGGGGEEEGSSNVGGEELALSAINRMLYTFHPNLGNTALRAEALCKTVAEVMELDPEDSRTLTLAAQMHDIGLMNTEVGVVRRWMRDPEKCTEEEMEVIKLHPEIASEILIALDEEAYGRVAKIVKHHHENWDGTGYPDKLKGQTIPRLSRLLAPVIFYCNQNAADVQLIKYMETELADHMFDPDAVRALVKAVPMTRMPRGEREILLIELKAGMELARPIFNTNNMKLLDAGKKLEDRHINKVHTINRMTPINPLCLVYC
jgi:response regulator RpfG family c-di-GMP phosphodiesterase